MGVTSVGSRETVRFGEEIVLVLESNQQGVARNSVDLNETQEEENLCHENDFGAGETSMGYGSASLAECFDRMGTQPNTTNPATCASGEGNIGHSLYTNPHRINFCANTRGPVFAFARIQEILLRNHFPQISQILDRFHFGANTCLACILLTSARIQEKLQANYFCIGFVPGGISLAPSLSQCGPTAPTANSNVAPSLRHSSVKRKRG